MVKVLVIGGTGNMGRPLVEYLLAKGFTVSVVCRRKVGGEDEQRISGLGGRYFYGDAKDKLFMEGVLRERFEAIVDFCIYSSGEFRDRIDTLLGNTDQYVCLSSAAVYADVATPKNELSPRYMEVDPPKEGTAKWGWYCYEKARIEDMLVASGRRNWTIVRPGVTMNANHVGWGLWWNDDWLGRIIRGRRVVVEKDILDFKFSLSSGAEVASLIGAVVGNNNAFGEVFNVCSNEVWTWRELLDAYKSILSQYGRQLKISYVNSQDVVKANPVAEYVYKRARLLDRVFDSAKVRSLIHGRQSSVGMKELLEKWTEAYVKNYKPGPVSLMNTVFMDRLAGDCSPRHDFCSSRQYLKYLVMRYCPVGVKLYSRLRKVF